MGRLREAPLDLLLLLSHPCFVGMPARQRQQPPIGHPLSSAIDLILSIPSQRPLVQLLLSRKVEFLITASGAADLLPKIIGANSDVLFRGRWGTPRAAASAPPPLQMSCVRGPILMCSRFVNATRARATLSEALMVSRITA